MGSLVLVLHGKECVEMIDRMEAALAVAELALEREHGVLESLVKRGEAASLRADEALIQADVCEEASRLLAQFADSRQAHVITVMQNIASLGLSQVFDEPIELTIEQVVRARRVEMDVKIKTGTLETPIMEARGGGLASVAGFLLRISVLLLTPEARKLMVLDETFAMLSEDYVPRLADFLKELCEKTGLQIILVTHQDQFIDAADGVTRIYKSGENTSKLITEK